MTDCKKHLGTLRLLGMHENLEYRLLEASRNAQPHEDFLFSLLEDEEIYRRNRKSERLRKRAKFRDKLYLEDFDHSVNRGISELIIKDFERLNFLRNNENLIIIGGTGVGKTFLAQAIGHNACRFGEEVFFSSVNLFFEEVNVQKSQGRYLNFLTKLKKVRPLILDDFGLRKFTHNEATVLYDVLEERYKKASLIITSQIRPEGWRTLFEDEVIAESTTDRMVSCSREIVLKGDSYRKNHRPKGEKCWKEDLQKG